MSSQYPGDPANREFLDSSSGMPMSPTAPAPRRSGSAKPWIIGGVAVAALAAGVGGTWAAVNFLGSGADPAEALPAGTLGLVSLNLDPSGEQKVEAIRTLNKFPAFSDLGIDAADDLREKFVSETLDCEGVSYAGEFEPWLGERFAAAAVPAADGAERPFEAVGVLQVTDFDAFESAWSKISQACGDSTAAGYAAVGDDWVLVGEQAVVDATAKDTEAGTLAESEGYATWTDKAGDRGIITMYAGAEAGALLAQNLDPLTSSLGEPVPGAEVDEQSLEQAKAAMEDFEGAAATIRFADGGLEFEAAADPGDDAMELMGGDGLGDLVGGLPEDTALAYGFSMPENWVDTFMEQVAAYSAPGESIEDTMAELEAQTGLTLPEDLEKLLGEGVVLAVGGDIDPATIGESSDFSDVPVGVRIDADTEDVQSVLDKLTGQVPPEAADMFEATEAGDYTVLSPSPAYRDQLAEDGSLSGAEAFSSVVDNADDAAGVLFVDFDAADNWLAELNPDDQEFTENVEPLSAFGLSSWAEDDALHVKARVSTD